MLFHIHLYAIYAVLTSAELLISYDAAAHDSTSKLDLINFTGINRQPWPKGVNNASLYFKVGTWLSLYDQS